MEKRHPYKRILLKLSGETLMGSQSFGINLEACQTLAYTIKDIQQSGLEVALVIGGGNIFRGIQLKGMGMPWTPADQMGMLATLMNGIALQQALEVAGCSAKMLTALECPRVAESYQWQRADEYLKSGTVLLFTGGTGNPFFTTDTAAALRASEIQADILVKATKVDGIYNKDPLKFPDAIKYHTLSYSQALTEKLEVMDASAIAMCRNSKIPIFVFNMHLLGKKEMSQILSTDGIGTIVKED